LKLTPSLASADLNALNMGGCSCFNANEASFLLFKMSLARDWSNQFVTLTKIDFHEVSVVAICAA